MKVRSQRYRRFSQRLIILSLYGKDNRAWHIHQKKLYSSGDFPAVEGCPFPKEGSSSWLNLGPEFLPIIMSFWPEFVCVVWRGILYQFQLIFLNVFRSGARRPIMSPVQRCSDYFEKNIMSPPVFQIAPLPNGGFSCSVNIHTLKLSASVSVRDKKSQSMDRVMRLPSALAKTWKSPSIT